MEIKQIFPEELSDFFKGLSKEDLINEKLLTEFLLKQVGIGFRDRDFSIAEGEYLPTRGMKIKIWPDELARFLIFLYEHKHMINSYIEFGTGTGGTFYVIDSYLRTINPEMGRSVTIDKKKNAPWRFNEYKSKHPEVEFLRIRTQEFYIDQPYDLCFIDADHSYKQVKLDYENMKDHCRVIAFHDIRTASAGVPLLWNELKSGNKLEIVTVDPRISFMSAIGVIWN